MARLLVVDDEKSICSTIEAALKSAGHEVQAADSGELAVAMMRKQPPDILLTDLRMDGMSGLELTQKIRTAPDSPNPFVPIVMLTGHTTPERVHAARSSPTSASCCATTICCFIRRAAGATAASSSNPRRG